MQFDIKATHPEYAQWVPIWTFLRDSNDGEVAVKGKGEQYLPMKSGIKAISDVKKKQDAYDRYKFRAEFPDILGPTIRGSAGLIHKTPSVIELPSALEPLRERATMDGLTLEQLHMRMTTELLMVGRYGLMPGIDDSGDVFLARYRAETIRNWDETDGEPDYVVLDESAHVRDPATNKWSKLEAYREVYLDDGGMVSRVWTRSDSKDEFIPGEEERATIRGRDALDYLPFSFVGSKDLTATPDDAPLKGLASLAHRAYVLDADYVNTLHMTSEPTPWVSGVDKKHAPTTIGAAALWVLSAADAKAGLLEFSGQGAGAQAQAIEKTLQRAMMFGAQLFADNTRTAESGDALETRLGHQTSPLKLIAESSARGLEHALKNAAVWVGADPDQVVVTPNTEFFDRQLSPQEITALVQGWMSGAYSRKTLFQNLQGGGIVDEEKQFEDELEEIQDDDPLMGGGDDGI